MCKGHNNFIHKVYLNSELSSPSFILTDALGDRQADVFKVLVTQLDSKLEH